MTHNIWIYIVVMAGVSFLIRDIPFTLFRKEIKNNFIRTFLYYVPYVTLAVMTFPSILKATENSMAALAAFVVGILAAWFGAGLFKVAVLCCATVFVLELIF